MSSSESTTELRVEAGSSSSSSLPFLHAPLLLARGDFDDGNRDEDDADDAEEGNAVAAAAFEFAC